MCLSVVRSTATQHGHCFILGQFFTRTSPANTSSCIGLVGSSGTVASSCGIHSFATLARRMQRASGCQCSSQFARGCVFLVSRKMSCMVGREGTPCIAMQEEIVLHGWGGVS